jgi:predicted Zn finger-like uncharacterized protein
MRVECPNCGTGGSIPDDKIPPNGTKIVCPKCKSSFFIEKHISQDDEGQDAVVQYREGVKLLKERHVDAAIEKFNMAIQANPQYGEAYRYLGVAYGQKDLWVEASQVLQKAITYQPDDVQSLKNLGVAYLKQEKFAEAEQVLQKALEHAPGDEKVNSYLSLATQRKEQQASPISQESPPPAETNETLPSEPPVSPPQAKPRPQRASKRDPIRELLDKGVEYLDNAQYNQAIETFNEAIRLDPKKSDGYFGLGLVYEKREDIDRAIDAYQKAVDLNPDDSAAKENLKFVKKQKKKKSRWSLWKK